MQNVELLATPNSGYSFTSWQGDATGAINPLQLTITSHTFVRALFSDGLTNIIIDNSDSNATFTGFWSTPNNFPGRYGVDSRFANCSASPTASVVYRPVISVPGFYDVSIWYPQNLNGSTKAPWFVSSESGTTNVPVDQRSHGGAWFRIASALYFSAGTNGFVSLSNNTSESPSRWVIADAVRFLGSPPPQPRFSSPALTNNQFQFVLNATTGLTYVVQTSTNLIDWTPLTELVATNATILFQDPGAVSHLQRFYRAVIR